MKSFIKSNKRTLLAIIILAAVGTLVAIFLCDPSSSVLAPKCMFKMFTGFDCPGCGTSRALYSMMHFDFANAWRMNPILFFAIPYVLIIIWLQYCGGAQKFPSLNRVLTGFRAIIVVITIIILYWIGRNV